MLLETDVAVASLSGFFITQGYSLIIPDNARYWDEGQA